MVGWYAARVASQGLYEIAMVFTGMMDFDFRLGRIREVTRAAFIFVGSGEAWLLGTHAEMTESFLWRAAGIHDQELGGEGQQDNKHTGYVQYWFLDRWAKCRARGCSQQKPA